MIRVFVALGIEKVRLTGGEPLLRKDIVSLVAQLAELRTSSAGQARPDQPLDLAITTNGHLLAEMAAPLALAGLTRITVSMDAVDSATFDPHHPGAGQLRKGTGRGARRPACGVRSGQGELCAVARL